MTIANKSEGKAYASFSGNILKLGNTLFEREIILSDGIPHSVKLTDKLRNLSWCTKETGGMALFNLPGIKLNGVNWKLYSPDGDKQRFPGQVWHFETRAGEHEIRVEYYLSATLPAMSSRIWIKGPAIENIAVKPIDANRAFTNIEDWDSPGGKVRIPHRDTVESLNFEERHLRLKVVKIHDITDYFDHVVETMDCSVTHFRELPYVGNVFQVSVPMSEKGLLIVKEAASPEASLNRDQMEDMRIRGEKGIQIIGSGLDLSKLEQDTFYGAYGASFVLGHPEELAATYRSFYRETWLTDSMDRPLMQSNTWGDRNQDEAISEANLLSEIKAAKTMGVPCLCLDDGWQAGRTVNSKKKTGGELWEGYNSVDFPFWDVNSERLPRGLEPLSSAALEFNGELSLWFSPDSSDDFSSWEKDADVLLGYYRNNAIRYFKMDGIKLRSKRGENNLRKFLKKLHDESDGQVIPLMDCTAEIRYGYFYERQYGLLFLENRYTDWANYYPHNTLKNLWLLSHWIPTQRLQIEVLNPRRNPQSYPKDPLAPNLYPMDYIFAISLMANPLIWMEMRNLGEKDKSDFAAISSVYHTYSKEIWSSQVHPIGEEPDGFHWTGFHAKNGQSGHILLFREMHPEANWSLPLDSLPENAQLSRLGGTPLSAFETRGTAIHFTVPEKPGYIWIRYETV